MAENKRSFLLYTDVYHTVKKLTDLQAGQLFKHILSYVNDENPVMDDLIIDLVFEPIKQNLKRDLRKYEEIRDKRSLAGKVSANRRQHMLTHVESVEQNEHMSTHSTVNVNVNDNVNVNVNDKEKKNKYSPFVSMVESEYSKLVLEYGEDNTKKFIDKLNNYKGSTGKKYKSDYLTILNWVVAEVLKENRIEKEDVFAKYLKVK